MTTLPQNTPLRLPRPQGATAMAGGSAIPSGLTGADVIRVLRGNLWLILVLAVVSAGAGYFVNGYLSRNHSRFTATGYCEISAPVTASPLRGAGVLDNLTMAVEQRTQVAALRSEALFSRVLQNANSPIRQTAWFNGFANPSQARADLMRNFSVNAIQETRLISASMQYSRPEDARVIVQEVVEEHLRQQSQVALNKTFDRTQNLNTMKLRVEADLRAVVQDRSARATELSQRGINPSNLTAGASPVVYEIEAASRAQIEAAERVSILRGQIDQLNAALQSGGDPPLLLREVEQDPALQQLQAQLKQAEVTLRSNESMGDANPAVRQLRARVSTLEKNVADLRGELLAKLKAVRPEELNQAMTLAQSQLDQANKRLDAVKTASGETANALAQLNALAAREQALRENLSQINEALDDAQIAGGSSTSIISWFIRPITPEVPSFPKLSATMSISITAGLAIALLIAFARELLNTSIRTPRDVAKVGPVAVLGTVPHEDDDPQSAGARLPLVIAEAPQSLTAEQLRQMRTRLQHAASLDTTRSLLVTSPNPGDGKTTVAANLAAGLALVGRRILLVDANFRRPELHRLFNLDNTSGFSNALAAPDQLADLAKPSKIPNLTVLASGPKPANGTEMLESALLHDFIEKALENYDHVVFDSGPILFASETVAMAPRVDGVITVVRAGQSTRGVLGRTKETLRQIKAESLGVVINGIRAHGGGYYSRNIRTYYEYAGSNGTNA